MRFGIILAGILALVLLLKWQFPYAAAAPDQWLRVLYLGLLLVLIGGSWTMRRANVGQSARYALIWFGIVMALVLAYSFRAELPYRRMMAELVPNRMQMTEAGELTVRAAQDGHFHIEAEVNGQPVDFMVDTGASDIVLSPRDAQRAGFEIDTLNYSRAYRTANGYGKGAPVRIDTLTVGPIVLRDLPASVNGADMDESLLGMAFLKELRSYSVEGDRLILKP